MLQLNNHSIIQFIAVILFAILIPVIMCYGRTRLNRLFLVFLFTSFGCSLVSLLTNLQLLNDEWVILKSLVPLFFTWSIVAFSHFAAAFAKRNTGMVVKIGYGWLVLILALIAFNYYESALFTSQVIYKVSELILNSPLLANLPIIGLTAFVLVRSFKASYDHEERDRITYLLAGLCFTIVMSGLWDILPERSFHLYHISYMANAVLITYILLKYRFLEIRLVMNRGLVHNILTLCITLSYLALLLVLSNLLRLLQPQFGIPITAVVVILLAGSFNWLRSALDKSIDRLYYGNRYVHRQMLLRFAGQMSKLIDIEQIATEMLPSLAKAIRARHVVLLLAGKDDYVGIYMYQLTKEKLTMKLKLHKGTPLIHWLEKEGKPLLRETIETNPAFADLSETDKTEIDSAKIELLCPVLSKNKLVGILAAGKKHPRGHYSHDDVDLVAMLCDEAAVAIENAQIYSQAKERANTDELTGLYNHRNFHERLDEEIARSSRFGNIFSLLFFDLDLFKNYNDVRGHLAGDEILQEIGMFVRDSIRKVDIGFRYGGDEFAIIMPQTPINVASDVAERLRRLIASRIDQKGTPVTCSIGLASWPTDGVMKEEIIQAADAALYRAKQSGKNRVTCASEVALSDIWRKKIPSELQDKTILNTIYALAATVDAKDHYTYGHSKKVSKYAGDIAEALGYPSEIIEKIRTAGLLHDIGKIGVADQLLAKRGPLSAEDWAMIRAHPNLGVSIIKHVDSLKDCLDGVQYHHESYDGKGYPSGLKGDKIPIEARIMAVADSYDAMTSRRPYRDKDITVEGALTELKRCAGKQFDPVVVDAFVNLMKKASQEAREAEVKVVAEVH